MSYTLLPKAAKLSLPYALRATTSCIFLSIANCFRLQFMSEEVHSSQGAHYACDFGVSADL